MRISLRAKVIILVLLVCAVVFIICAYFISNRQREALEQSFQRLAISIAQALDASLTTTQEFEDRTRLQNTIYKLMWLHPEVAQININFLTDEGLKTIVSNDATLVGTVPSADNFIVFTQNEILTKKISKNEGRGLKLIHVITPIQISGKLVGTYEIGLSLETLEKTIAQTRKQVLAIISSGIFIIALAITLFLRVELLQPITELKKGIKIFGSGNLDYRIEVRKKDELGDLASGFNSMAAELQKMYRRLKEAQEVLEQKVSERTKELEEAKTSLQIKVRARTQELEELTKGLEQKVQARTEELQEKINELERFQKLAVGRELRMVGLKEEVERLEKESEKHKSKIKQRA